MVYTIHMELREGDLAKNQYIRSSRRSASYNSTRTPAAASSGRRIDRPWPACQLDEAARQESSNNQTLRGHPAGRYEKSNYTRQTRGRTVYFDFWPSPPPSVPYGLCTPLRPKWSFQDQWSFHNQWDLIFL